MNTESSNACNQRKGMFLLYVLLHKVKSTRYSVLSEMKVQVWRGGGGGGIVLWVCEGLGVLSSILTSHILTRSALK
jgi:hypothetical protein